MAKASEEEEVVEWEDSARRDTRNYRCHRRRLRGVSMLEQEEEEVFEGRLIQRRIDEAAAPATPAAVADLRDG